MTTKPKAQKFRVRRSIGAQSAARMEADDSAKRVHSGQVVEPQQQVIQRRPAPQSPAPQNDDRLFDSGAATDGFGDIPFPGSAAAEKSRSAPATPANLDEAIDAIRREGLTGRQLRMARRVAQKHGLAITSDFDAVRQLRAQGIDPFQRAAMLELVTSDMESPGADARVQLPQTVERPPVPSKDFANTNVRDSEIFRIQRDIAKRRQRKMILMVARLAVFVGLPTLLAGIYFYTMASPMYATKSEFIIQQAEPAQSAGLGSLLSGSPLATSQDSITVQSYLQSRDAMLRLDADVNFKAHFANPEIDAIQRLEPGATNEQAYKLFQKNVTIGYDPTEGLIKMEVVAADPAISLDFSNHLLDYAEERVDDLTQRLREDQMKGARESYQEAEQKMLAAQERVVTLQEQLGVISPDAETGAIMGQIGGFETQLQEKRLQLQQLLDNTRPNQARVEGVQGDIRRLEALISDLRGNMTQTQGVGGSLARITSELRMAEVELTTRQMLMQQSLQALEASRIEANRQVRYLSLGVSPVAPDEPTYPRKFENTVLAFFVFAGIYLMASLTAAVLREQVSA